MQRSMKFRLPIWEVLLCVAVVAGGASYANAQDGGSIGIDVGAGNKAGRIGLNWESAPLWSHEFSGSGGHLDLVAQIGVAYWNARGSRTPDTVWQFGVIPALRWTFAQHYYLEAGVGPTVFTRTQFADTGISTAFQFGSHLGAGIYLSPSSRLGISASHYSNAGIKRPNPGLNIVQMSYWYQY